MYIFSWIFDKRENMYSAKISTFTVYIYIYTYYNACVLEILKYYKERHVQPLGKEEKRESILATRGQLSGVLLAGKLAHNLIISFSVKPCLLDIRS